MRKLGRKIGHRSSMLKNQAISFLIYEKITTTEAKAKEVRSKIEKAINISKGKDLQSKRRLLSMFMHNKNVVKKLTEDISVRYKDQNSGYIKMYKIRPRLGDNAPRVTMILSKSKFLNTLEDKKTKKVKKDKKDKK